MKLRLRESEEGTDESNEGEWVCGIRRERKVRLSSVCWLAGSNAIGVGSRASATR